MAYLDPNNPSQDTQVGPDPTQDWFAQNAPPPATFTPVTTSTTTQNPATVTGGISGSQPYIPGTANGTDVQFLSYLLSQNPTNPQAAIDQFNQLKPTSGLHPAYYPNQGKGVIGVQGQALPYLVAPGTINASQTDWTFGGVPGGDSGGGTIDSQTLGGLIAPFTGTAPTFTYPSFSAPSGQDVLNQDPGYGFRLGQGEQALQGSAAARGVLNTGGTLKDILNYGQSAASQEYADAFNRALGTYTTNRDTASSIFNTDWNKYLNDQTVFWTNQNGAYNKLAGQQNVGLTAAQAT